MSSASFSPAAAADVRLHRHALESVFAFCRLRELAAVLSVSNDWRTAVLHMAPIRATVFWPPASAPSVAFLPALLSSPLHRHVDALDDFLPDDSRPLTVDDLGLLIERVPNLRKLKSAVAPAPDASALLLPPLALQASRLSTVDLSWNGEGHSAGQINSVIAALGALQQLVNFSLLWTCSSPDSVHLAPLRSVRSLRRLVLHYDEVSQPWSEAQLADLRTMQQLDELGISPSDAALVCRLLAPGHALRLCSVPGMGEVLELTDSMLPALLSLPTLKTVRLAVRDTSGAAALRGLPALEWLSLRCSTPLADCSLPLLASLRSCGRLQYLNLRGARWDFSQPSSTVVLTSATLSECFSAMPELNRLTLAEVRLDSLAFLAEGALPRTLTELNLSNVTPRLPPSELTHVLSLKALRCLSLWLVLSAPPDEATTAALTPPSAAMPALFRFGNRMD